MSDTHELPRTHPTVDLSTLCVRALGADGKKAKMVQVTCPDCNQARWKQIHNLRTEIRNPNFTGRCRVCQGKTRSNPRKTDLPIAHPSVDMSSLRPMRIYTSTTMAVKVTCPHCESERWTALSTLRQQLQRANFTGQCRSCGLRVVREGHYRWAKRKNPKGNRWITSAGYVTLSSTCISDEDLPLFRSMQTRAHSVSEHRWVMAKFLGRAITSRECIDHMNGNKTDNRIENLRLYVRGKQEPGSCPGHGTYYHEWKMAEAEVKRLQAIIDSGGYAAIPSM